MPNQHDLTIQKPVSVWNRELSIPTKSIFSALGNVAISTAFGDLKGVATSVIDFFKDISFSDSPEQAAWVLINKALFLSLEELLKEESKFFIPDTGNSTPESLAQKLEEEFGKIEVGFDASFFDHPEQSDFFEKIKAPLKSWLEDLGMSPHQAESLFLRLKNRFVSALHDEWLENPDKYECIKSAVNSPFVNVTLKRRQRLRYRAWLIEQANGRVFGDTFALKEVYVPLRAYYKVEEDGGRCEKYKCVIDLHSEMEAWVQNFQKDNAVRLVSGGPGAGKSSFAKMFAAHIAKEMEEIDVLLIPLHHFNLSDDLISAVEQFAKSEKFLEDSPLDPQNGSQRLIVIFDGLDELLMQGKSAYDTAISFIDEVITKINQFNSQGLKRQALITGRDLAIQSASIHLRKKEQIFHLLPYFLTPYETRCFYDENNLLSDDQRDEWWKKYSKATGKNYDGLPKELAMEKLIPITREPLLNYLVALSYERKKLKFSEKTTLNAIYNDLLEAVYERQWAHGPHAGARPLELQEFIRVLEEIAVAVWHGDGRTATVENIYEQCQHSNLRRYLERFQEGAKKGVSRLLTAFYFRQSSNEVAGEKTFEFTHKSFGEYLTARRIVRLVEQIHNELKRHDEDPDSGFTEMEALERWVNLCGQTPIDKYLFRFLLDEVAPYSDRLEGWQKTFARLLGYAVRKGTPMEKTGIPTFKEMLLQSQNAEEALMVIHYICAIKTKKVVEINWGDNTAFGEWIRRIQGQRINKEKRIITDCLAYLDLSKCILDGCDFHKANFNSTIFYDSSLEETILTKADLREACLREAYAPDVQLAKADLTKANLENAYLRKADLRGADLRDANLGWAFLIKSNLAGADIRRAKLESAKLQRAILERANFVEANLGGAELRDAIYREEDLKGAILDNVI